MNSLHFRQDLVKNLMGKGLLGDPAWRKAFLDVPREYFVPVFATPSPDGKHKRWNLLDKASRKDALAAVYKNTSLLTQQDTKGTATSSSTMPSLMAMMLEHLDVRDGMRVLEIGTGTGYNAALLCHRLGDKQVVTVDIDEVLVDQARTALDELGYRPALLVGDGVESAPEDGLYDRLIATCSVSWIPHAWFRQVRTGGIVVANLGFGIVRLERTDDHLSGPFVDFSAFMPARQHTDEVMPTGRDLLAFATGPAAQQIGPFPGWNVLEDPMVEFLRSVLMPGIRHVTLMGSGGREYVLVDYATGSWTRVTEIAERQAQVTQKGTRRLWDELYGVIQDWLAKKKPPLTSYFLTIDAQGQHTLRVIS
jgi:protein-L-isoaspartate O-methyltransferase